MEIEKIFMYAIPFLIFSIFSLIIFKSKQKPTDYKPLTNKLSTLKPKQTHVHNISVPSSWTISFWIKYLVSTEKKVTAIKINNTPFAIFYPKERTLQFKLYTNSGKFSTKSNLTQIQSGPYTMYKHFTIVQDNSKLIIYEDTTKYIESDPHQDMTINSTTDVLKVHPINSLNAITFHKFKKFQYAISQEDVLNLFEKEYEDLNQMKCVLTKKNRDFKEETRNALKRGDPFSPQSQLNIIK